MPEITPQLRRGLVALCALLIFAAVIGVAVHDDSTSKADLFAGDRATTSTTGLGEHGDFGDDPGLVAGTPTTVSPTGPRPSIANAPGTTAKPKTSAPTTRPSGGAACSSAPVGVARADADPGAAAPPAPGAYTYESTTDREGAEPCKQSKKTIAAGSDGPGVIRRTETMDSPQGQLTNYNAWRSDSMKQERLVIVSPAGTIDCDWNPDPTALALPLSNGKTWSADSSCDTTVGGVPLHIRVQGTGKVTGTTSVMVGGTKVNTWIIDSTIKLTISGPTNQTGETTTVTYFDPTHGLDVYSKSVAKSSDENVTVERRLTSLNPA